MADWLGSHRGVYVLLVLFYVAFLWGVTGFAPLRRLIQAERKHEKSAQEVVRDGALSVAAGCFGLFLVVEFAFASLHLWAGSQLQQYLVWFCGAGLVPFVAYRTICYLSYKQGIAEPTAKWVSDFAGESQTGWQPIALVSAFLLTLPLVELTGFSLWAWLMPAAVLVVGALLRLSNLSRDRVKFH